METIEIKCMWGYYDSNGWWQPNYLLKMSADEQRAENIKNGYVLNSGVVVNEHTL